MPGILEPHLIDLSPTSVLAATHESGTPGHPSTTDMVDMLIVPCGFGTSLTISDIAISCPAYGGNDMVVMIHPYGYIHTQRGPPYAYLCSSTFLFSSITLFTSPWPFSTTFSIIPLAFFRSSGLALLASSIALNFFCCFPLASLTAVAAFSPALLASLTDALRDSAVGGGMLRVRRRGFVPFWSG